ncbi:apolipoprotein D-like isoform X1 [Periplaneta americana]|uniref:apolipoprotein D-like isoform X1 n=1 Tax=Periplaneta americana TaxID=6978 RepID=UPI0037E7E907
MSMYNTRMRMCKIRMNWMTMSMMQCVLLRTVIAGTMQQCPEKNFMTDFNMTRYVGEWNEILRIPNTLEEGYSCMMDKFTNSTDGATNVRSQAYNTTNGVYVFLDGTAAASTPGRFDITYSGDSWVKRPDRKIYVPCPSQIPTETISSKIPATSKWGNDKPTVWSSSYWVLGTDYDRYVVLWGCLVEDTGTIRPLSWVSSRQKNLDEDAMREVEEILTQNGLNRSQYEEVSQTDCPQVPTTER